MTPFLLHRSKLQFHLLSSDPSGWTSMICWILSLLGFTVLLTFINLLPHKSLVNTLTWFIKNSVHYTLLKCSIKDEGYSPVTPVQFRNGSYSSQHFLSWHKSRMYGLVSCPSPFLFPLFFLPLKYLTWHLSEEIYQKDSLSLLYFRSFFLPFLLRSFILNPLSLFISLKVPLGSFQLSWSSRRTFPSLYRSSSLSLSLSRIRYTFPVCPQLTVGTVKAVDRFQFMDIE